MTYYRVSVRYHNNVAHSYIYDSEGAANYALANAGFVYRGESKLFPWEHPNGHMAGVRVREITNEPIEVW